MSDPSRPNRTSRLVRAAACGVRGKLCRAEGATQLLEAIIGSVLDFSRSEQLDDITLVVAQSKAVSKFMHHAASSSHLTQ